MIDYKIFVIFHDKINIKFYDPSILEHLVFLNVNPNNTNLYSELNVVSLEKIPGFIPLGKWYTESEVIYNVFKNNFLISDCIYVGFVHYDIDMTPLTDAFLQREFEKQISSINLQPYLFKEDYKQNIIMDNDNVDTLRGAPGKNCYLSIFDDYNHYYKTSHRVDQYLEKSSVNLCSSFIINKADFNEMMNFVSPIIESKKLDKFDTQHKYRIQGGFLERYYATWVLLQKKDNLDIKLKHEFVETNKQMPWLTQMKIKVKKRLRSILNSVLSK